MPEYESSVIRSAQYDQAQRVLEIEFNSGAVYRYADVPVEEAEAFAAATSKGGYFTSYIRNSYATVKVDPDEDQEQQSVPQAAPEPSVNPLVVEMCKLLSGLELTNEEGDKLIGEVMMRMRRPQ
jgi:hypothetical protein